MKDIEIFSTKNNEDLIQIFKVLFQKSNSTNKIKFMVLEREIIFWLCPNILKYEHRDGLVEYERNKHYKHKEFGGGYIQISSNENDLLKIAFQGQSARYKHPHKNNFIKILENLKIRYKEEEIQFLYLPEYRKIWEKEENEFLKIEKRKMSDVLIKISSIIVVLVLIAFFIMILKDI